jgi:type II secretory pathway component PulK
MNKAKQRGVALAIVVWFIAGMSLLVAGIVSHARVDTQMAQLHVARAKAAAAGDGAIQLMMAELATGKVPVPAAQGLPARVYRLGELEVAVNLVPATGLIDLNGAPVKVLAALFIVAGGLVEAEAQTVADNVVKWRSSSAKSSGRSTKTSRFAAMEDLLRVDGVSRTLLDAVRDYIVAGAPSQRGTNWSVAPEMVLAVLQQADPQKAGAAMRRRGRLPQSATESGAGNRLAAVTVGSYRLDAVVRYGDKAWLRRRWVAMGMAASSSSLPWRMVRTEAPRVIDR